ncbi:hypothetical protein M0802_006473 [Mischocyttarus mexicanus]|nr:hypothetical protein M0802_006473 [Mischocyttarus mexicanus]
MLFHRVKIEWVPDHTQHPVNALKLSSDTNSTSEIRSNGSQPTNRDRLCQARPNINNNNSKHPGEEKSQNSSFRVR